MTSRLAFLAVALLVLSTGVVKGQFAAAQSSSILNHFADVNKSISIHISRDFKYKQAAVPPMHLNVPSAPGDPLWTGSVSAQSFNNGKFGRFYCWDAQGNLRSSYLFKVLRQCAILGDGGSFNNSFRIIEKKWFKNSIDQILTEFFRCTTW
jgi:hypothetical protein